MPPTPVPDPQLGLPGRMHRPVKITIIGAGSMFTPCLVTDFFKIPLDAGGEIALVDIDEDRLTTMYQLILKLATRTGRSETWHISASRNRRDALAGSHYLINCIEVSGLSCVRFDYEIPLKYGVDQCIGDTIGPGGLFKGLRTIPAWLEILRDAEALCPDALVLNYTNPMNMLCLAAGRSSFMRVVGLCHSVQSTSRLLAWRAGVESTELEWQCAGVNHLAWFTSLRHHSQDLYPLLMEKARRDLAGNPDNPEDAKDLIRKDIMLHFGAFVTESSGHLSEYLPYYRKRKDLVARYCRDRYDGASGFYAGEWPAWRSNADLARQQMLRDEKPLGGQRSWEYASWIVEAREKNAPFEFHGNVMNTHPRHGGAPLISNLSHDGCVEVACGVNHSGVIPRNYGRLPAQMAALCESNMRMFDLAVTAAIEQSKEAAIHAMLLDPLSAAACSPAEIKQMTLELFEAEAGYLNAYR